LPQNSRGAGLIKIAIQLLTMAFAIKTEGPPAEIWLLASYKAIDWKVEPYLMSPIRERDAILFHALGEFKQGGVQFCHRSLQKGPRRIEIGPFWWFKIPHLRVFQFNRLTSS
jgi:hypothetical protein